MGYFEAQGVGGITGTETVLLELELEEVRTCEWVDVRLGRDSIIDDTDTSDDVGNCVVEVDD